MYFELRVLDVRVQAVGLQPSSLRGPPTYQRQSEGCATAGGDGKERRKVEVFIVEKAGHNILRQEYILGTQFYFPDICNYLVRWRISLESWRYGLNCQP